MSDEDEVGGQEGEWGWREIEEESKGGGGLYLNEIR